MGLFQLEPPCLVMAYESHVLRPGPNSLSQRWQDILEVGVGSYLDSNCFSSGGLSEHASVGSHS